MCIPPAALAAPSLIAEVLDRFGHVRLRVQGTSMLPALRPSDEILVHRCDIGEAAPGDLVLFAIGARLFVHRVTRVDIEARPPVLITRGDALRDHDEPVPAARLMGRVVAATRGNQVLRSPFPSSRTSLACAILVETLNRSIRPLLRLRHRA